MKNMLDNDTNKILNPKIVELLDNLNEEEIEKLKSETKDESLLKEILYTLRMVPKLK